MKWLLRTGIALLLLSLALTALLSSQSPRLHESLIQQITASGLAREHSGSSEAGFTTARHSGSLQLASSYCPACGLMQYQGTSFLGLGTLLDQRPALASIDYALRWPQLPLQPPLPPLRLRAAHGLFDGWPAQLKLQLSLPASSHQWRSAAHGYQLVQQGSDGILRPGQLTAHSAELTLQRDDGVGFRLADLDLAAAASEQLRLQLEAAVLELPHWQWLGRQLQLDYQQQGGRERLNLQLALKVADSTLAQRTHGPSALELELQRLNLDATLAFANELPRLLSPQTTAAARMLGLFSLYSVHGPGFFQPRPALKLQAQAIPLTQGLADVKITLAVTAQTERPPMHPLEWRRALQGEVDISAPAAHLAELWRSVAAFVSYATGLPAQYSELQAQGWVASRADGRQRLHFLLDPLLGPQQPASISARKHGD